MYFAYIFFVSVNWYNYPIFSDKKIKVESDSPGSEEWSRKAHGRSTSAGLASIIINKAWQQFLASQGLNNEEGTSFHSFLSLPQFEKTRSGTPGRGEAQRKQQTSDLQFMTSYTNIYYIKIFKIKSNERHCEIYFCVEGIHKDDKSGSNFVIQEGEKLFCLVLLKETRYISSS